MADKVVPGPSDASTSIHDAVCVNVRKIFDSCRDKDCVDDLRVYPTLSSQGYIERALSVRPRSAELLHVDVRVAPVHFNRGYYTVDCTYFYRITSEAYPSGATVCGLAIFDKRVMLFGSESRIKTFDTDSREEIRLTGDLPRAVLTSVDPICLHCKLAEADICTVNESEARPIPDYIAAAFPEELVVSSSSRRWFVTLGQFSLIRLERDTQLMIPAYDYCLPDKESPNVAGDEDPCTLFGRIRFPVEEFFPPDNLGDCEDYRSFSSGSFH